MLLAHIARRLAWHGIAWGYFLSRCILALTIYLGLSFAAKQQLPVYVLLLAFFTLQLVGWAVHEMAIWRRAHGRPAVAILKWLPSRDRFDGGGRGVR
jgi:hypothetical protein